MGYLYLFRYFHVSKTGMVISMAEHMRWLMSRSMLTKQLPDRELDNLVQQDSQTTNKYDT
jgi:hypothetical protein